MTNQQDSEQQCGGCRFRSERAEEAFGHTKCSNHRPCTGNKYWEPDHCSHCLKLEDDLKSLSSKHRYAQLGRLQALLLEVKRKVEERGPQKNWEFMPIFEYKFKKFSYQTERIEQHQDESPPIIEENLNAASPTCSDTLQISQDDDSESDLDTLQDADIASMYSEDHSSNMLLRDRCTALQCILRNDEENCPDPVHTEGMDTDPMFKVVNKSDNGAARTPKRKRSPASYRQKISAKAFCRSPRAPPVPSCGTDGDELPKQTGQTDFFTGDHWIEFNHLLHTRKGWNMICIKARDMITGFIQEKEFPCKYKTSNKDLFQITKPHKTSETFIDNASAHSAFGVSFELQPTSSEYLSATTFLNSNISEESSTYSMLMELKRVDPELTRTLVHMKEEDLRAHFTKHAKNFSTHTFINFLTGFTLSDQEFASFTKEEPLCVRRFESLLGTYDRGYSVANNLLLKEKESRMSLLHTIATVHLMELYAGKVALVPEEPHEAVSQDWSRYSKKNASKRQERRHPMDGGKDASQKELTTQLQEL